MLPATPIRRAHIVDDEPDARESYQYVLEDMGIRPHKVLDPLQGEPETFLTSLRPGDAVLSDYHLKKHSYAQFNGDTLVSTCVQAGYPGVLCTTVSEPLIRRDALRYIPALIKTGNPTPEELRGAWDRCEREIGGDFEPTRRGWRTLVRVDSVDTSHGCFYVVIPAWDVRAKVRIYNDDLPSDLQALIQPEHRFHAFVNTGTEHAADLFFDQWEPK